MTRPGDRVPRNCVMCMHRGVLDECKQRPELVAQWLMDNHGDRMTPYADNCPGWSLYWDYHGELPPTVQAWHAEARKAADLALAALAVDFTPSKAT